MTKQQIALKIAKVGYPNLTEKEKAIYNATDMREILYEEAINCLGINLAPINKNLGCVEALNNLAIRAIGRPIGGGFSSYWLYDELTKNKERFKQVKEPLRGDVIISPSGHGNGKIKNGHTGIVSDDGKIMSNDSAKLLWLQNWTIDRWKKRYQEKGGFPVEYFRVRI